MKRILLAGLVLVGLGLPGTAIAERIRDFQVDLWLEESGELRVEERIVYDFEGVERHGIYRDIPVRYERAGSADYRIALDVESVTDASGAGRPFALSNEGELRRIRIGSRSRKVTGVQEYRIRYRVRRGILWLEERDELYWNATGTQWRVPIDAVSVRVNLPDPVGEDVRFTCFTGPLGSTERDCEGAWGSSQVTFSTGRRLRAREGLSFAIDMPKGVLTEPSQTTRAIERASDFIAPGGAAPADRPSYWALSLPFLTFIGLGAVWRKIGRDPGGAVAIPVRYEPPEGMTPAEMGTVLDERVDMADITATILDLAVRGYLRIEEKISRTFLFLSETDYVFHRSSKSAADLKAHEDRLLGGIFARASTVELSSLKNRFHSRLPLIEAALYREVSRDGRWFPTRPDEVRFRYAVASLAVPAALAVVAFVMGDVLLLAALVASGGVAFFWSRHMPRKTRRGRRARQHILGFQEFLERVERDRLERLGLHDVSSFERLLPYAFVLGVADAWADAFADLYTQPPDWYAGHGDGAFRPRHFISQIGRSLDTAGNVMRSTPSPSGGSGSSGFSSGGGFSGGGFGGGGGGSW